MFNYKCILFYRDIKMFRLVIRAVCFGYRGKLSVRLSRQNECSVIETCFCISITKQSVIEVLHTVLITVVTLPQTIMGGNTITRTWIPKLELACRPVKIYINFYQLYIKNSLLQALWLHLFSQLYAYTPITGQRISKPDKTGFTLHRPKNGRI